MIIILLLLKLAGGFLGRSYNRIDFQNITIRVNPVNYDRVVIRDVLANTMFITIY